MCANLSKPEDPIRSLRFYILQKSQKLDIFKKPIYRVYEKILKAEINEVPRHIAVIQDGNRRFARERGKDPTEGHTYGAETTENLLEWANEVGIEELTLYTFSTENFNRSDEEVETLFDLMERKIDELSGEDEDIAHSNRIRVKAIGETDRFPEKIQNAIEKAEEDTKEYNRYQLNVAIGYGGRAELLKATREIMEKVKEGEIEPEEITTQTVSDHIYTADSNDVDLIIRTGGDVRLSNFLPWQAKGNESTVYFCAPYWPEFRKIDFLRAIRTFGNRQRQRRDRNLSRAVSLLREFGFEEFNNIKEMVSRYNPETRSEKGGSNRTNKTKRVSKND